MFGWFNPFGPPFRDDTKSAKRIAAYAKEQARENTIRRLPCGDLVATIKEREYRSHSADCWYDAETGSHASESVSDKAQGLARRLKWAERDAEAQKEQQAHRESLARRAIKPQANFISNLHPDAAKLQSDISGLAARTNKPGAGNDTL